MNKTCCLFMLLLAVFLRADKKEEDKLAQMILGFEKLLTVYRENPAHSFNSIEREFDAEILVQKLEKARSELKMSNFDAAAKQVQEVADELSKRNISWSYKPVISRIVSDFDKRGNYVVRGLIDNLSEKTFDIMVRIQLKNRQGEVSDMIRVMPGSGTRISPWQSDSFKGYFFYPPLAENISTVEVIVEKLGK